MLSSLQDNHWTLVSNNLELRSRRFSIRHLRPETDYELRVRANNEAGSSERVFAFETVSRNAAGERLGEGSSLDSRGEGGAGRVQRGTGSWSSHTSWVHGWHYSKPCDKPADVRFLP